MKTIRIAVAVATLSLSSFATAQPGSQQGQQQGMFRRLLNHVLGTSSDAKPPSHVVKTTLSVKPKTTAAPSSSRSRYDYEYGESMGEHSYKSTPKPKLGYEQLAGDKRVHIDALFKQTGRPTLAQLKQTLRVAYGDALPTENPFGQAPHVKDEAPLIADMVAQLEHAFPGGQWLPLGRDAVLIADALDGFYGGIGQSGRVKRLDMSGLSLPHYRDADKDTYEADRPMIYGFLKSNGLDLANAKSKAPYVMIDVTSYSSTSQSTQLMRSTYRTWVKEFGGDPKALYDRVNFVGTPMGGHSTFISEAKDIDATKAKLRAETGTDGPKELLYLGGNMHKLTYTAAWHRDFTKMYKKADGTITADEGEQSSLTSKQAVLAELYEVNALTTSPAFVARVQKIAAEKYGYEFPMKQTETLVRLGPKVASHGEGATADTHEADTGYLRALKQRLPTAANKHEVATEFVRDLAGMWARKSFTKSQTKEAIREIQRSVDLRSTDLASELRSIYTTYPGFREVVEKALRS